MLPWRPYAGCCRRPSKQDIRVPEQVLSHDQAKAFYDRFGARQDAQSWYENPALEDSIAHVTFDQVRCICEFGCGTGKLAAVLLGGHLHEACRYVGLDISDTMVDLACERLAPWKDRVEIIKTRGDMHLPLEANSQDLFISTYVFDLLSVGDIRTLIREAGRILKSGGRLCLVGLTSGVGPWSRLVSHIWRQVHRINPAWVGGCRPIHLMDHVPGEDWRIEHHRRICRFGICSEVLIASNQPRRINQ